MKNFLQNTFLSSRAYSLYWRTADMLIVGMADGVLSQLELINLPNGITIFIGLILGELTKYLNTKAK